MKFINVRMIDGTGSLPKENVTLQFDHRFIQPTDDEPVVMDMAGKTIIPGMINAHVHVTFDEVATDPFKHVKEESAAGMAIRTAARVKRMLEAGITCARDLGGINYIELAVRDMIKTGEISGPRLYCAGKQIMMTGGQGWPVGRESDGADEVRKAAREQIKAGADIVKLMATGGILTLGVDPGSSQLEENEMRAGVEEAKKANRKAVAHAQGTAGVKAAIRAGVDTVEHGIFLDDEAIQMMIDNKVVFVPTLTPPYRITEVGLKGGMQPWVMEKMDKVNKSNVISFQRAYQAGVIIAAGNDGGTPKNPHHDMLTELRLMVEFGVPVVEAIRAGTWGSARAIGIENETGTIEIGKWADLVVLDGDPMTDIYAVGRVEMVVQGGKIVYQKND
jgi:imidazolonepropionase-like amidohydrolase